MKADKRQNFPSSRLLRVNGVDHRDADSDLCLAGAARVPTNAALQAAAFTIARELTESIDIDATLHGVIPRIAKAVDAYGARLARLDSNTEQGPSLLTACEWVAPGVQLQGTPPLPLPCLERDFPELFQAIRAGHSLHLDNVTLEAPLASTEPDSAPHSTYRTLMVPVHAGGELAGLLTLDLRATAGEPATADVAVLKQITALIGAALRRAVHTARKRVEAELDTRLAEIEARDMAVLGSLERLAGECELSTFLTGHVLSTALDQVHATCGTVIVRDLVNREWRVIGHVRHHHIAASPYPARRDFGKEDSLVAARWDGDDLPEPFLFDLDAALPIEWPGMLEYHRAAGDQSILVMPLTFGKRLVGFLVLGFDRREVLLGRHPDELLKGLARGATLAIELSRLADSSRDAAVLAERNRIGQEIHDGLAQAFTGILMQLGAAESDAVPHEGVLALALQRIRDLAREGLAEARRSVLTLRQGLARRGGLASQLEKLAERSTVLGGARCSFSGGDQAIFLPPEVEHELLRIAQEAVSNAVRHAAPANVRVEMRKQETDWLLRIVDDGSGLPLPPQECAKRGFGLSGMQERTAEIGGTLEIHSQQGLGTCISVRLPRAKPT